MLTLPRAVLAALLTTAAFAVLQPSPVAAQSCESPEAIIPKAKILLTGRIVDVDPETDRLTVVVKEGWRGGPVPARAVVRVKDIAATEWSTGLHDKNRLYLFAPRKLGPGQYEIGPCDFWNPSLHRDVRPEKVARPGTLTPAPEPTIDDEESHSGRWLLLILGITVIALWAGAAARRRRARAEAAARAAAEAEAAEAEAAEAAAQSESVDPDEALLRDAGDEPAVRGEDPREGQPPSA